MTEFARLLLVTIFGRILLYLWMEFPLPSWVESNKYIRGWHECDLCGGMVAFSTLFCLFRVDVMQLVGIQLNTSWGLVIDAILGGAIISFICHLLRLGWQVRFGETLVIE